MAEVKPMSTQNTGLAGDARVTENREGGAGAPAGQQQQQRRGPVAPDPVALAAEEKARAGKLYDLRKTADPAVYERVAAFHPHASTSDAAFDAMKADLDRLEKETADAKTKADAAAAEAEAGKPAP